MIITFLFENSGEMHKRLKINPWIFLRFSGVLKDIQGYDEVKRQSVLETHLRRQEQNRCYAKDGKLVHDCWSHWIANGRYFISLTEDDEVKIINKMYPIWKTFPGLPLKFTDGINEATMNLGVLMAILFLRTCNAGRLPGVGVANTLIDMANDKELN